MSILIPARTVADAARRRLALPAPAARRFSALALLTQALILGACDGSVGPTGPNGPTPPQGIVVGSGVVVTVDRAVSGFSSVQLNLVSRLIIEQTGVESLTITGDDNLVALLESDVVGGRLVLKRRDDIGGWATNHEIVLRLTVRTLDEIDTTGGIFNFSGPVEVVATGIDSSFLKVILGGPSTMTVAGRVDVHAITIGGPASYNSVALQSREAVVDADGPSRVTLRVSERLSGTITNPALVEYCGDPTVAVTGSGFPRSLGGDC